MKIPLTVAFAFCLTAHAQAATIFPNSTGTRWDYQIAETPVDSSHPRSLAVTIGGREQIKDKEALRLETRADDVLQKTEFIISNAEGVVCLRRASPDGKAIDFDPPQRWLPAELKFGESWELDDEIAGHEVHQQFTVKLEDDIVVPAGKFHAFLCEATEPWPISTTIQRWFSPGVGLIKEITTTRGPTGRLLGRKTVALQKFSRGAAPANSPPNETSSPSPTPAPPVKVILIPARERDGEIATDFRTSAPNIFVRWTGENLPVGSHVRVAWVAEDVGDLAEPGFVIDQSDTVVTAPQFGAQFTLSRPADGWAPGKYRVELYLDDKLLDTASVTIKD